MVLTVSELASRGGVSADAVRYYGRLGLLPETGRTGAGHRYYDEEALERLRFIKGAQWLDLRLDEIRGLLAASDEPVPTRGQTREVILRRIAAIDDQQVRLGEIRAALCRLLGDDYAVAVHRNGGSTTTRDDRIEMLTIDTAPTGSADSDGCTCCSPPARSVADEIRELQARRDAVERRLAGLGEVGR